MQNGNASVFYSILCGILRDEADAEVGPDNGENLVCGGSLDIWGKG